MTQQPRRKRGVILTPQGKQKLLAAIREFENEHHFGEKYTIEELSSQTGLDPGTVAKVLDAEAGADRRSLDRLFRTLNNLDALMPLSRFMSACSNWKLGNDCFQVR
jgi:AraC-like DNA-binding protein